MIVTREELLQLAARGMRSVANNDEMQLLAKTWFKARESLNRYHDHSSTQAAELAASFVEHDVEELRRVVQIIESSRAISN